MGYWSNEAFKCYCGSFLLYLLRAFAVLRHHQGEHLREVFFIHFLILCLKWAWRTLQKGTNFLDCTFNYLFNIVTSVFKGENCILLQTCALFGLYFLKFITSRKLCIVLYGLLVCNFFIFGTSISLSITVCQFGSS